MEKQKNITFAYYADGKFIGWYADSFGSVRPVPKLYTNTPSQIETITQNFSNKIKEVNESSFDEAKEKASDLRSAISLAIFDSEEKLRGKDVELRVVECPIYDGPDPNFDEEKFEAFNKAQTAEMKALGIFDIPAPSAERTAAVMKYNAEHPRPAFHHWIYADYKEVKAWAANEPTEFIGTIKPR